MGLAVGCAAPLAACGLQGRRARWDSERAAGMGGRAVVTAPPSAGCDCSPCGTEGCDPRTGRCLCKAGVTGPRCDRCQVGPPGRAGLGVQGLEEGRTGVLRPGQSRDTVPMPQDGHFGFEGCGGCQPCACGPAAEGSGCHPQSGQCRCRPGTAGLQCRECAPGYWGLPEQGCRRECDPLGTMGWQIPWGPGPATHPALPTTPGCQCQGGPCDLHTGRCTCPPGLSGERCDTCDHQHQVPVPGGPGGPGVHCEGAPLLSPALPSHPFSPQPRSGVRVPGPH